MSEISISRFIKDPKTVREADYVVIESTYGNRLHGDEIPDYVGEFTRILQGNFCKRRNVVDSIFRGRTYTGITLFYS